MNPPHDNGSRIELQLEEAGIDLAFELPDGWTWQRESVPRGAPPMDPEGRLNAQVSARNADGRLQLQIAASRMKLPMGLVHAVVYWTGFYGFDEASADDTPWREWPALGGWFKPMADAATLVAATWIEAQHAILELRLGGPIDERAQLQAAWDTLRVGFRCVPHLEPEQPPAPAETWSTRARALREDGRLDEAIALIEREADRAEALLVQSDLHAQRMREALDSQQPQRAREAWRQAVSCAQAYAACATSGGEGAARSLERDRVIAALGPEPQIAD